MAVSVADLVSKGGVYTDIEGSTPQDVYRTLSQTLQLPGDMTPDVFYNALCDREKILTTAVGNGIALPHAQTPVLKNTDDECIAVCYLKRPISMGAPDERPVYVMFVLMTSTPQTHLAVISQLARYLQNPAFRQALENKANCTELITLMHTL